jgi:CopG family nickel-responsive transcriptional regulator
MSHVDRFSVSLDTELLAAFDRHIAAKGYSNRSEAIRDLIRDLLATGRLEDDRVQVIAFVSLECDGRAADAPGWLRSQLAKHADLVCASLRIPLRGGGEAESIALRGQRAEVQAFVNELRARRGLTHVHLTMMPREGTAEDPASCSLKQEQDTEEK